MSRERNSSCSFRPIVLKLHGWLGHGPKMCILFAHECQIHFSRVRGPWFMPKICFRSISCERIDGFGLYFAYILTFSLKQLTQELRDTDYQLPILLLKYHNPNRDIPNFLHCPFFLQTNPSVSWILQNRYFSIQIRTCVTSSEGATPLTADFLFLTLDEFTQGAHDVKMTSY